MKEEERKSESGGEAVIRLVPDGLAPQGLGSIPALDPRLAPWAAFLRRSAAAVQQLSAALRKSIEGWLYWNCLSH